MGRGDARQTGRRRCCGLLPPINLQLQAVRQRFLMLFDELGEGLIVAVSDKMSRKHIVRECNGEYIPE
jgi:hypothetical protein